MSTGQKESPGLMAAGLDEGISKTLEVHAQSTTSSLPRQAAVFILLEPGHEARIIPVVDDDSQEPSLALLIERAQRMVKADTEELRR